MGPDQRIKETPEEWWNGLSPEAQRAEIKAGHVRVNLPSTPDKPERTPAQMKADRRRARGKR